MNLARGPHGSCIRWVRHYRHRRLWLGPARGESAEEIRPVDVV
jgi:hypothetical protein